VKIVESVYHRLPVPLQHAAYSLKGWNIERTRHGRPFRALLAGAEERTYWSPEQMAEYRNRRLQTFVQHAASTVPFYRRRFRDLGVEPEEIRSVGDLEQLPLLTKEELRECAEELVSEAVSRREQLFRKTSGTTGTPLRIASTLTALMEQEAIAWRFRRWHGIELGTWCAWFGGAREHVRRGQQRPPFWRINHPGRQIFFSSAHSRPEQLQTAIDALRRRRPPWLHGLPSTLVLYASQLVDAGEDLGYPLGAITTAGENLLPQQAELIERAFGVRPRQRYVMTEAAAHASECELGSLHLDEDLAAVELLSSRDGLGCRVVGTNLSNLATPLLRYDTGDDVTISAEPCPCGRPGRTLEAVDGRLDDYIVLPDRSRMESFPLGELRGIRAAQLYQARIGQLTIRVLADRGFGSAERDALLDLANRRVGAGTDVVVELADDLVRAPGGKVRFMISDLAEGSALQTAARNRSAAADPRVRA
jgi:phenylacetate-CoA ligase